LKIEDILKAKTINELTPKQRAILDEYDKVYKEFAKELFIWMQYFYPQEELDFKQIEKIEFIGITTPAQILCLYIQNQFHSKNAERKSAFTSKKHKTPFNEAESEQYLLSVANNLIMDAFNKYQHTKNKQKVVPLNPGCKGDLSIFTETTDLDVAAGYLTTGLNVGTFQMLQDTWRSESSVCNLTKEKLEMIRDKSYRGVSFNINFTVRKRFMRKLYKKFLVDYNYNQWKELWFK